LLAGVRIMMKKEMRRAAMEKRNLMSAEQVSERSGMILRKLFSHPWFIGSHTVFTYVSMNNEAGTDALIKKALEDGRRVCVPRVIPGAEMVAVPIRNPEEDLETGFFNCREPKKHLPHIHENEIDLIIVPGLVFDRCGYRIGYGGGYYDKYLRNIPPGCRTIGLAFSSQITDRLPREEHDVPVMLVITEDQVISCCNNR